MTMHSRLPRATTLLLATTVAGGAALGAQDVKNPEAAKLANPVTSTPESLGVGKRAYDTNCAACHGKQATGTDHGPPLVHKIYEPNHHGDPAFQLAAANGVRAHHWEFGDMPKIDGVTPEGVDQVVKYVRWLQRQAGIQ